jgi:hypothetical protein
MAISAATAAQSWSYVAPSMSELGLRRSTNCAHEGHLPITASHRSVRRPVAVDAGTTKFIFPSFLGNEAGFAVDRNFRAGRKGGSAQAGRVVLQAVSTAFSRRSRRPENVEGDFFVGELVVAG